MAITLDAPNGPVLTNGGDDTISPIADVDNNRPSTSRSSGGSVDHIGQLLRQQRIESARDGQWLQREEFRMV